MMCLVLLWDLGEGVPVPPLTKFTVVCEIQRIPVPYVWLPKYKNYSKIAKTVLAKAPEVSKLRLSNFVHARRTI